MTEIDKWREERIKVTGLPTRLKAEAQLEKQLTSSFVECQDSATGEIRQYRKPVADILKLRGEKRSPRKVFSVPLIPGFNDKK